MTLNGALMAVRQSRTERVVFRPNSLTGMQRGIAQIAGAVRPTLGPRPRLVAVDRVLREAMPEMLDNGGLIARRIVELPDRDADVGAMLLRNLLWRLYEQAGDGTATAAVLFQSVYDQGLRYIASGGDATRLRGHLDEGARIILEELSGQTMHLEGRENLTRIAGSICYDPKLAGMLGEIFDVIGEHGTLELRSGPGRELEREYVEGVYWEGGILSREMLADHERLRAQAESAAIVITDLEIEDPRQLVPLIETAKRNEVRSLVIVGSRLSDGAIALLLANQDPATFQSIAVRTPGTGVEEQSAAMQDLAILTGGRPLLRAAGASLSGVKLEDLGRARRAWADRDYFGIAGGKGDPRRLRRHISGLRASLAAVEDPTARTGLRQRVGRLMSGSATLWIGGTTDIEISARKALAERTAEALRGAMREGVLPGGGVCLLACRPALQRALDQSTDVDERAAYRILLRVMEEPIRTIIGNGGYDSGEHVAGIVRAGPGHGFDATSGQVVDVVEAGILDAATVVKACVRGAISSAALALTVDILIHHEPREEATAP